jgi:hypothetical protein
MSGRLFIPLLFVLSLISWPGCPQVSLNESIFLPPRFFVGDRVELRLKFDTPADLTVDQADLLPEHPWIEFQTIEVQDRRASGRSGEVVVRLFFIPFQPGESSIPAFRLGDLGIGEISVTTQSVLEAEQTSPLRGPRTQLNLPMTWLKLLILAAVGIGAPVCMFFFLRYGVRGIAVVREARIRRLPYVHARKSLNRLSAQLASIEGKSFFILLSLAVRRYLTERLSAPLMSAATGEILKELNRAGLEEDLSLRIHEVLKAADVIKFSGKRSSEREMQQNLKAVGSIVGQIEERTGHVES